MGCLECMCQISFESDQNYGSYRGNKIVHGLTDGRMDGRMEGLVRDGRSD